MEMPKTINVYIYMLIYWLKILRPCPQVLKSPDWLHAFTSLQIMVWTVISSLVNYFLTSQSSKIN